MTVDAAPPPDAPGFAAAEAERVAGLERRIARLEKINSVLMDRVESGVDSQANAYSLFQTAIGLERQVRERTDQLTHTLRKLERVNDELVRAKEIAERADRAKSRFLAQAGHDLMQPLAAARLSLSTLDEVQTTTEGRGLVRKVERGLASIEALLRTLLDISRLDAGAMVPRIEPVALGEILADLSADFAPIAARRGLRLDVVATRLHVASDVTMLTRILQNLIGNALRYTERGRVLVGVRRQGADRLRIDVIDTGPGIPEDQHGAIFEEFHRGRVGASDGEVGLGLGLSIVQRLGEALDHPITMRSTVARGSIFSVEVPRCAPPPAAPAEIAEEPGRAAQGWGLADALVLVVDDDPDIREAMVDRIGTWSCRAIAAADAVEADILLTALGRGPDLLLVDWHLARGIGLDVVDRLRAKWGETIPAVVLTADPDRDIEERVAARGLELMRKPVRPAELRALMAHLLS